MKLYISIILSLFLVSCKTGNTNPEIDSLYEKVMAVHDEVMPEMSTIHRLKKRLQNERGSDSLTTLVIYELDTADEQMMSWMADFGAYKKLDKENDSLRMAYLNRELNKINDVKDKMLGSIRKAEELLGNSSR